MWHQNAFAAFWIPFGAVRQSGNRRENEETRRNENKHQT